MDQLIKWDRDLLVYLNGLHADWLDGTMYLITNTEFWIPLYLVLIFLIFKEKGKRGWVALLGVAVTILLADQITSSLMKPLFHRLRPSHEPILEGVLHIVNGYRGGLYGFASSHAANTFGIATFIFLFFRARYKWIGLIFLWSVVMTYTRIYLGVHYPGDIIVGGLIGVLSGFAGYWVYKKIEPKPKVD